jgi:hypothetical protein
VGARDRFQMFADLCVPPSDPLYFAVKAGFDALLILYTLNARPVEPTLFSLFLQLVAEVRCPPLQWSCPSHNVRLTCRSDCIKFIQ